MLTDLVAIFPNLATEPYVRTSDPTFKYNCFAYAAGDDTQPWDPGIGFWPDDLPTKPPTLPVALKLFAKEGFERCDGPGLEDGFDKVVIYGKKNLATHAAKQLADGQWSSKLGELDDITHTLAGLIGDLYGEPKRYMKRRKAT